MTATRLRPRAALALIASGALALVASGALAGSGSDPAAPDPFSPTASGVGLSPHPREPRTDAQPAPERR